jgi:hypothetical protein
MNDNKEKVIDSIKVNIEAVLDDKALNDIADKLYEKFKERLIVDFEKAYKLS